MAIINNTPRIYPANNKIEISEQISGYFNGTYSEVELYFNSGMTAGQTFTIGWTDTDGNDQSVTFIADATFNPDGTSIPPIGAETTAEWMAESLQRALEGHPLFGEEFEMTGVDAGGLGINCVLSKKPYNAQPSFSTNTPGNISATAINGSDSEFPADLQLKVYVYIKSFLGDGELDLVSAEIIGSDTSYFKDDFASVMRSVLSSQVPTLKATYDGSTAFVCDYNASNFFQVGFAQVYGSPPVEYGKEWLVDNYAWLGGISELDESKMAGTVQDYYNMKWLSQMPSTRWVPIDQPIILSHLHTYQSQEIGEVAEAWLLKADFTYSDGTEINDVTLHTQDFSDPENTPRFKIYHHQVDSAHHGRDTNGGFDLVQMKVWVAGEFTGAVTEKITYIIRQADHLDRFLLFKNAAGGYETISASGGQLIEGEFFAKAAYGPDGYVAVGNRIEDKVTWSAGAKDRATHLALRDILNGQKFWHLVPQIDGSIEQFQYMAEKEATPLFEDDVYSHSLVFRSRLSLAATNHSHIKAPWQSR